MAIQVKHVIGIIIIVTTLKVECIPVSPCPMIFHYEFDGQQWIGVAKIYPQIYNRFRTDHIILNLALVTHRRMPNLQNLKLLQLKKSLQETYQDIAERQPIQYRINFPFRNDFPELLIVRVNGFQLCRNELIFYGLPRIELQSTLFLPKVEIQEESTDEDYDTDMDADTDATFEFNPNSPQPAISNSMIDIPSVVSPRVDEEDGKQIKHPRSQKRLLTTNSQCGTVDESLKYTNLITGGNKIKPGTWPWLVAIFHKDVNVNNPVFQCTGSLISNRMVLTAAHCFKSDSRSKPIAANKIILTFGQHDIRDSTEKSVIQSGVEQIIVHPEYLSKKESKIFEADIAILITKNFIEFTSMIKPICLWPASVDSTHSLIGTNVTLVGWGQPFENEEKNVPRRLKLPVVRNGLCFPSDRSTKARRVICAGTEKQGNSPCSGDSGSALAIHANGAWFLRGIVSAALGDPILNRCDLNTYAIFTDIIHFRDWIDSHM